MLGKLYLVATPIGNLDDITFRAIKVLKEVDLIAAEDTRHTLKLLNYYEISKPLISYHRHNEEVKSELLIQKLLEGKNIAVVTDAGTPGISDPGEEIVKEAIKNEIEVVPIPGACALINALISSGLNTKEFAFYGFLPLNKKNRKNVLERIKKENKTVILYEAPHKLIKSLEDILENIGDINCVLAKELTRIHEEFFRGDLSNIINDLSKKDGIKGEYIILLDLSSLNNDEIEEKNRSEIEIADMPIEQQYEIYIAQEMSKKDAIKQIAKNKKVPKDEIYKKFIQY